MQKKTKRAKLRGTRRKTRVKIMLMSLHVIVAEARGEVTGRKRRFQKKEGVGKWSGEVGMSKIKSGRVLVGWKEIRYRVKKTS